MRQKRKRKFLRGWFSHSQARSQKKNKKKTQQNKQTNNKLELRNNKI